ncbi:MAG: hypothetical protein V3U74_06580 [Thermodesulfobacteriota bacterium]
MATFFEKLPEQLKQFTDPASPKEKRLMAAQGTLPIPPKDMALVLFALVMDGDDAISDEASESLEKVSEDVIGTLLSDNATPAEFLHYIARTSENTSFYQKIILNSAARDVTVAHLAGTVHDQSLLDIIASNQQRLLRSEVVFEALSTNQHLSRSTLDRIVSFLSIFFERKGREAPDSLQQQMKKSEEERLDAQEQTEGAYTEEEVQESFFDDVEISDELTVEREEEEEISEEKQQSLYQMVRVMRVAEKIKLAMFGNKEARTMLSREPERIVVAAVVKSPRITESEIVSISQSTAVDQDILRQVSLDKRWGKSYSLKQALVNNPKTPPPTGLALLKHLRENDLFAVSKSRNVPGVISSTARKMIMDKKR